MTSMYYVLYYHVMYEAVTIHSSYNQLELEIFVR